MKFSYAWLQEHFDAPLPPVDELARIITMHSFELEGVEIHGDDSILDIKVLPNRSHDCFSYAGMASEIGALLDVSVKTYDIHPKTDASVSTAEHLTLTVENSKLVPRAMKRYVEGVTIGESPEWLKAKLSAHGQRSINNVVDATNFVMLETGQPVHAFDYDKLTTNNPQPTTLSIRQAKDGEMITTLDGKEFTLDSEVLVISDSEKALDIAGVKGGSVSGIDVNTMRVVLSVCNFDPVNIRKTSKKLGLRTDASVRFENAITPELTAVAMEQLSALVEELAGGKVAHDTADVYPNKKNLYVVGVSLSEINTALGTTCSADEVGGYFKRFGFEYTKVKPIEKILSVAPTLVGAAYKYGASVISDAPSAFDCSSLIAYLYVQLGIAIPRMTVDQFVFGSEISRVDLKAGDIVFALGDHQGDNPHVIHHESKEFLKGTPVPDGVDHNGLYLGDGKILQAAGLWYKGEVIIEDLETSPSFKSIVGYRRMIVSDEERFVVTVPAPRLDIRIKEDLIEEIGRLKGLEAIPSIPLPDVSTSVPVNKNEYYKACVREALVNAGAYEVYTYAFQPKGDVEMANPLADDKKYLRSSLVDGLTSALELSVKNKPLIGGVLIKMFEIGTVFSKNEEHQELGIIVEKQKDLEALCATVDEALAVKLSWKKAGNVATASFTDAVTSLPTPDSYGELPLLPTTTFKPISTYPFVLRDIAVWVTDGDVESVPSIIRTHGGALVARIDLFDTFSKEGRTSYAYHIVFQSYEKTLSDIEVSEIMKKIEDEIREKGWEVR